MIAMQFVIHLLPTVLIICSGSTPNLSNDAWDQHNIIVGKFGELSGMYEHMMQNRNAVVDDSRNFILHQSAFLRQSRKLIEAGSAESMPAATALRDRAVTALSEGPFSVTQKGKVPPSGDIHDYYSIGPYWWPDPEKEDGLPYVRRDGEHNPELYDYDRQPLREMLRNAYDLALAWYFFNDERFAAKSLELLRVWFLDPETKMNPNLKYGQHIPGRVEGRGIGIIDTRNFCLIPDMLLMVESSGHYCDDTKRELQEWMARYLDWLWNHPYGQDERVHPNNHSTSYDVQTASLALFTGDTVLAHSIIDAVPERRINQQIRPDGRQPEELERTNAFAYSAGNVNNFFLLGVIGEYLDIDVFGYVGPEGQSIRKALEFLLPYAMEEKEWTYQQIAGMERVNARMYELLKKAAHHYDDRSYADMADRMATQHGELNAEVVNLLYP